MLLWEIILLFRCSISFDYRRPTIKIVDASEYVEFNAVFIERGSFDGIRSNAF